MLQEGIQFDQGKQKYVCVLPWIKGRKEAAEILNALDSESMAKRRVVQMMPRFNRDPVYKESLQRNGKIPDKRIRHSHPR